MHKAKKNVKIKHRYGGLQQAMSYLQDEEGSLKSVMKQTAYPPQKISRQECMIGKKDADGQVTQGRALGVASNQRNSNRNKQM